MGRKREVVPAPSAAPVAPVAPVAPITTAEPAVPLTPSRPAPIAVEPLGIRCPRCGCRHLPVYYVRPRGRGKLRVRVCRNCGRKVVTRETVAEPGAA